ncbi:MAG: uridine kinase, partial [Lachnospiraceae bacterium]|nr:uridine kinase [Lachnospiraceae bacterium]
MISTIIEAINSLPKKETSQIIAIDGRCAAGKTSLAAHLQEQLHCPVIHMDHFFLRPEQRTKERLATPGGNVDYERFLQEVITPLHLSGTFSYRPFDCKTQSLTDAVRILPKDYVFVEGSYSCHPALRE